MDLDGIVIVIDDDWPANVLETIVGNSDAFVQMNPEDYKERGVRVDMAPRVFNDLDVVSRHHLRVRPGPVLQKRMILNQVAPEYQVDPVDPKGTSFVVSDYAIFNDYIYAAAFLVVSHVNSNPSIALGKDTADQHVNYGRVCGTGIRLQVDPCCRPITVAEGVTSALD
jgi:hypothetical protein